VTGRSALAAPETVAPAGVDGAALRALPPAERAPALAAWLRGEVARLTRVSPERLVTTTSPLAAGLDSLAAIELQSAAVESLGVELPLATLLSSDWIEIAAELAAQLAAPVAPSATIGTAATAAETSGDRPLSPGQRALWFLHQMAPRSSAYNVAFAVRFLSPVDEAALAAACQRLVDRHPALRTTFPETAVGPVRRVAARAPVVFTVIDAAGFAAESERRLSALAAAPFDVERGPLARFVLVRGAAPALLLAAHHLVVDLWSLVLLLEDLRLLAAGAPAPAVAASGYDAYVAWQAALLAGPRGAQLSAYWRDRLAGELPILDLPADRPRPPVASFRGAALPVALDAATTGRLQRLASAAGTTLYTVLLTAFQALLGRYTGQVDLTVGSPAAGRGRPADQEVVGYFVNLLVCRADLTGDPTFTALLARSRDAVLGGLAHQDFPFPLLVERLEPVRDPGRSPLFQAAFVLEKPHRLEELGELVLGRAGARGRLGGWELAALPLERRGSQFDLTLSMVRGGGGLAAAFEYATDLFDRATVARLAGHLAVFFAGLAAAPETRLAELPLLAAAERHQLLLAWNDTRAPLPEATLHGLVAAQAGRTPDAVAIRTEGGMLSYGELDRRAGRLAHHLRGLGVGPDAPVAVAVERSLALSVALLGALKAGGAYVPLDPGYPRQRLSFMLADSRARVLLTEERLRAALPAPAASGARVLCLDSGWAAVAPPPLSSPTLAAGPDHLAYVIYTSGSTGQPKGAAIPHRGIVNRLLWMQDAYGLGPGDQVLQKTVVSFDVSVWELFWPLLAGATVVMARPGGQQDSAYLAAVIDQAGITTLHFVPSMLHAFLAAEPALDGRSLRLIVTSGEALAYELKERCITRLARLGARLENLYGPTEASVDVTAWSCAAGDPRRGVPIGRPIANTAIRVLDPARLAPQPAGLPGELAIGGVALARGYLGRPERTAERFVPDPCGPEPGARLYRTGDLVRLRADGTLEYLGRLDHQVKVRGFRVELGEIEAALGEHPEIGAAVVVARTPPPAGGARLVAYLVPAGERAPAVEPLRRFLRERLPEHALPAAYVVMPALPLSPNGKVDRRALPAPGDERPQLETPWAPPRTPAEEALAAIWSAVLGIARIGIDDNFFALGGDSIRSIEVRARARQQGLDVSLEQLFLHQTIRDLATALAPPAAGPLATLQSVPPFALVSADDRAQLPPDLEDAYPLAQLQAGFVFHSEYSPSYEVYVTTFRLRATFDLRALAAAAAAVVARHPVLRASFDLTHASEPLQLVHRAAQVEVPIEVETLTRLAAPAQEDAVAEWLRAARRHRFDWSRPPLFRLGVHRLGREAFQLTLVEPLLDGWSVASLMTELLADYQCRVTGEVPPSRPPLALGLRDFVALEREAMASAEQQAFWTHYLAGMRVGALPRRPGRARTTDAPVSRVLEEVPVAVLAGLQALARSAAVPLKSVLLAAHLRVVALLAGSPDVVTGVLANGRPEDADGDKILGTFLNALPLRRELGSGTWTDLARAAFDAERELLPFRRYPLAQLQREHGGRALFETAFNFTNFHVYQLLGDLHGLAVEDAWASDQMYFPLTVQFNLDLSRQRLIAALDCDGNELAGEQVRGAMGYYLRALADMAERPGGRYGEAVLLSAAETHQLRVEWNDTASGVPGDRCLHERFEAQAERTPAAEAVRRGGEALTYAELNRQADRLAHHLRRLGVGPEVPVGICTGRSLAMVVGMLAVLKAGGAYLPLDPAYPGERLRLMLEDAGAPLVLTEERFAAFLGQPQAGGARRLLLDSPAPDWALERTETPSRRTDPAGLAYLIYTSGSTGRPKAVAVRHSSAVALLDWAAAAFTRAELASVLASTSICFDLSVFEIFVPLAVGGRVVLADNALELPRLPAAAQVTLINTVPSALAELVRTGLPAGVRTVNLAGEPLRRDLIERTYAGSPGVGRVLNLYGPSEDTTYSTWAAFGRGEEGPPGIGRPISGTRAHVLTASGRPLPIGVVGELVLGGAGLARGYLGRPELTAERFLPDPTGLSGSGGRVYRTGDLARFRPDGSLDFLGRVDQQVKIRGFRIELGEVEAALARHPAVGACALSAGEDVSAAGDPANIAGAQRLVAYVVAAPGAPVPDVLELRSHLKSRLPEHMVPSAFVFLDRLPRTPNGKLDRSALPAPERPAGVAELYLAPRDAVEADLAELWAQVLHVDRVGVRDDFFALGGHSLIATQLISRARERFGVEIAMSVLFERPTVEALALALAELRQAAEEEELARMLQEIDALTDAEVTSRLIERQVRAM